MCSLYLSIQGLANLALRIIGFKYTFLFLTFLAFVGTSAKFNVSFRSVKMLGRVYKVDLGGNAIHEVCTIFKVDF